MDLTMILIFVGLMMTGFIMGYPVGMALERRTCRVPRHERMPARPSAALKRRYGVLNAKTLEDRSCR